MKKNDTSGRLTKKALDNFYKHIIRNGKKPSSIYFNNKLYKIGSKELDKAIKEYHEKH